MKQTKCHECWGLNGRHWPECRTRGYGAVGPHPDAPARDTEPPTERAEPEMCCGGTCVRALCFIHSTEPRPEPTAAPDEAFDLAPGAPTVTVSAVGQTVISGSVPSPCGHYIQTYRNGKLVDEEPIEAYGPNPPPQTLWQITESLAALKVQGLISDMSVDVKIESPLQVCFTVTLPGAIENVVLHGVIEL